MDGFSIQLNKLGFGNSSVLFKDLSLNHQKEINRSIQNILAKQKIARPFLGSECAFSFDLKDPFIEVSGKKIPLEESRALKKIRQVIQFYQNTGVISSSWSVGAEISEMAQESTKESEKMVRAVHDSTIAGTNGKLLAGMRIADDTLVLAKETLSAIPDIGPTGKITRHLGYYAGAFWTFFSLRELDQGRIEYKRARLIGDAEGRRRAKTRLLSGSIVTAGALTYLSGQFVENYAAESASIALSHTANVLFGVGAVLALGTSFLGTIRCSRFEDRLNLYLNNPNLDAKARLRSAVLYLKNLVSVTEEEQQALIDKIEKKHPGWSDADKEKLYVQKLKDLTEVKVKYMKRRTSSKALFLLIKYADQIIAELDSQEKQKEGIEKATLLICAIQRDTRIKRVLYQLSFIAALISFVAMLVSSVISMGLLPFVFYGISAAMYLSISIYSIGARLQKKKLGVEKPS